MKQAPIHQLHLASLCPSKCLDQGFPGFLGDAQETRTSELVGGVPEKIYSNLFSSELCPEADSLQRASNHTHAYSAIFHRKWNLSLFANMLWGRREVDHHQSVWFKAKRMKNGINWNQEACGQL